MHFTVTASNDAHIGFFDQPGGSWSGEGHEHYEIVLSGWGNTQSVIREASQGENHAVVDTTGFLSPDEPREFWASAWRRSLFQTLRTVRGVLMPVTPVRSLFLQVARSSSGRGGTLAATSS